MSSMSPFDELRAEHDAITVMLDVLESVADRAERGERLSAPGLGQIVEFLSAFADRCHHTKEEQALIPEMVAAGVPREGGMVADILAEHVTARGYARGFADAVEALQAGDRGAATAIAQNARDYSGLIRRHTEKENTEFFPLAEAFLKPEQLSMLTSAFDRIESERLGHSRHEELEESLAGLREVYLGAGAGAATR
jgi:hemerythrin-like domain-containing protein